MDAGKFDRRVTLQRQGDEIDDGFSTKPGAFTTLASVWARLIPLTGAERASAGETAAYGKANIEIRKDSSWSDLNAKDRFVLGSQTFNIVNVNEPRRGFLFVEGVARADG
jgi:SPP1 family predicted phage head-tail adaptor